MTDRGQAVALLTPLPHAVGAVGRLHAQGRIVRPAATSLARLPVFAPTEPGTPSAAALLDTQCGERP